MDSVEIAPAVRTVPLTSGQRRIWFAEQRADVGPAYVLDASLRLTGPVRVGCLADAFRALLRKHPMLGLRVETDVLGRPRQWVDPDPVVELDHVSATDEAEALRIAEAHLATRLNPAVGPILAPLLITITDRSHYLAIGYHHLAGDGMFSQVLRQDLMAVYGELLTVGHPDTVDTAPDIDQLVEAEWTPQSRARMADDTEHTVRRLAGAPSVSTLPTDRARSATATNRACWIELDFPDRLVQRVAAFAADQAATPFLVYSLAMHVVLQRFAGQSTTLVGFMSGNRTARNRRRAGLHTNTLVQRLDLADDPTVTVALRRLKADLVETQRHGRAPFENVVERRGDAGVVGRHPVFQTMINYVPSCAPIVVGELVAAPVIVPARHSWLDLEVRLHPEPTGGLRGYLRAPLDLYDESVVAAFGRGYLCAVENIVAGPESPVSRLAVLRPVDRAAVVAASTGPQRDLPGSLHGLIIDRIRRSPAAVAITFENRQLTYAELGRQATAVCTALRARGVGSSSIVALGMQRCAELVPAIVGVILAGAAILPIGIDQPATRREFMLSDTGADCVLVPRAELGDWIDAPCPALGVEDLCAAEATGPIPTEAGSLAYVLYTSGSTGQPKAVACTRVGLVNRLLWMARQLGADARDVLLQKTPYTFDVSMWEFFLPFVTGARLVVAPPDAHADPGWLAEIITEQGVTIAHFVPSMLRIFQRLGELSGTPTLRHIVASGEALPADLARDVLRDSRAELWNYYGPTEAGIDVTSHACRRDGLDPATAGVPIGRPVDNTIAVVLDGNGGVQPVGAVGELWLGGVQLAEGYVNRPELTEQRFVDAPRELGSRLYRTGDLARLRAGGTLEYLGRTDRQVKLRGVRIEPGEIEATLVRLDGVLDAVVLVSEGNDAVLVAYLRTLPAMTEQDVTPRLATELPPHLVPARCHLMSEFPLLSSGKVDRTALAELDRRATPKRQHTAPTSDVERRLLGVLHAVVERTDVGVDDSFFACGGDSVRSIELVVRARAEGIGFDVVDVFNHPTVRQLALVAHDGDTAVPTPEPFTLVARDERMPSSVIDAIPLNSALAGLVVESGRPERYRRYWTSLLVDAEFDPARFADAVRRTTARHPILRGCLWRADAAEEPVLVIHDTVPADTETHDLRSAADAAEQLDRWREAEAVRPVDWYTAPLSRIAVHLIARQRFSVTLSEPYLDGYSASLVLRDLIDALAEPSGEPESAAVRPAGALVEHVRAERAAAADPEVRRFWQEHVADAGSTRIDALDAVDGTPETSAVDVDFGQSVSAALTALNRTTGIPIKSMLLAAHARAVATLCAQRDVCLGLMANGRPGTEDGSTAAGMFLNVNVLRVPIQAGTWWDLVQQVHAIEAASLPARMFPFAELRRSGLAHGMGTLFNYTHFHAYRDTGGTDVPRIRDRTANDQTYLPLTAQFQLDELDHRIKLRLEFFGAALPDGLRRSVAAVFEDAVRHVAERPGARHDECALGTATVPPASESTPALAVPATTVVDMMLANAAAAPDGVVAVGPDDMLTAAQLVAESRGLAGALVGAGVRPGDPVAVELPRSAALVVALFAVLLAGGLYTPVDPDWPSRRRAAVVGASGCRVMLTYGLAPAGVTALRPDRRGVALATSLAEPAAPGFLIHTSGSTGAPSGVELSHRAMANRIAWYLATNPVAPDDRLAARASIGFVDSLAELLTGPCAGMPTVLLSDVDDPRRLVVELGRHDITRVTLVPTLLAALLDLDTDLPAALPSLRRWTLSGETFPIDLARRLRARLPYACVDNLYGSTEIAADALHHRYLPTDTGPTVPLGRPIAGVLAYAADPWGNVLPEHVPGELRVRGDCLAIGYRDDPVRTEERFSGRQAGDAVFATRDLVRYQRDQGFVFLGRTDRQLKIRGVRIEPATVEARLRSVPGIRDAAVAVTGGQLAAALCAYLVSDHDVPVPDPAALRAELAADLPAAAVPARFAVLTELPRTASGKVDHRLLPEAPEWLAGRADAARAPGSPFEVELARLWTVVLGTAPAAVADDFFELGGNSLHAVMLAASTEDAFGVAMTVGDLFDAPTLGAQAELVQERVLTASTGGVARHE